MAIPPSFTSGSVLTAAQLNAATALNLVKTQSVGTSVASVTVSGAFSADYDNYRIEIGSIDASGDGAFLYLTLGSANTGYYGSCLYDKYDGLSTGTTRRNNSTLAEIGVGGASDNTSTTFDIQGPYLAKSTTWSGTYFGGGWSGWFGGWQNSSTQFTSFTLAIQAGSMTGGTVRVYGYRNS